MNIPGQKILVLFLAIVFLAAASFLMLGAGNARNSAASEIPTPPDPIPDSAVICFEDINYGGHWFMYYADRDNNDLRSIYVENNSSVNWNDRISSLKVGKNACLTVWKDIKFTGSKATWEADGTFVKEVSSLVPSGWNDKISSLKIRLKGNCAKS